MSKLSSQLKQLLTDLSELQKQTQSEQEQFHHSQQQILHSSQSMLKQISAQLKSIKKIQRNSPLQGKTQQAALGIGLGSLMLGGLGLFVLYQAKSRQQTRNSLRSAAGIDLKRFAGKWFEIARMPGKHKHAAGMTLNYTLNGDQSLDVVCNYHDHDLNGREHTLHKHLYLGEPDNHAHLRQQLFGKIGTDYWILEVGKQYDYAVLGTPSRKHLWILSRTPKLDEELYAQILERMQQQDFDVNQLVRVEHDEHSPVALSTHLQTMIEKKQEYFKGEAHKHHGPGQQHPNSHPQKEYTTPEKPKHIGPEPRNQI